jgi:hypothetical protein
MTDAPNGWPDPSRPGVPLHPERDGWHWVDECAREWSATEQAWLDHAGDPVPAFTYMRLRYLGPCLTRAEVAAALAAQAMAMRQACAAIVDAHAAAAKRCSEEGDVIYRIRAEFLANSYAITQAADDVRVTPLPDTSALDAMLAEARREGMRSAAEAVQKRAWEIGRQECCGHGQSDGYGPPECCGQPDCWISDRAAAAAILAAAIEKETKA